MDIYLKFPHDASTGSSSFKPPSVECLAEVDRSPCEYNRDVVEIEGVVGPESQGGWPFCEEFSIHCFCFAAWRHPGQEVNRNELVILRPVPEEGDWFSEFPQLSLHRIKVLLSTDETRAVFAGTSTVQPESSQLIEIAEELATPLVIQTEQFGELRLNRSVGWFEGEADWNDKSVRFTFEVDDSKQLAATLQVAEQLWSDQRGWEMKVNAYAVQELLSLKNECWLGEDEAPLTPVQFLTRMTLVSITIRPDGKFEFWHNDGDLFWGHSIQISGSLDKGLQYADIPG